MYPPFDRPEHSSDKANYNSISCKDTEDVFPSRVQIALENTLGQHQLRPRFCTAHHIGFDESPECVLFMMRKLDIPFQQDAVSGPMQPVSQFNVFEISEGRIKTLKFAEDLPFNRAISPAKRGGFLPRYLMGVMMNQILASLLEQ